MPGKTELLVLFIIFGLPLLVILAALIDILKSEFQVAQKQSNMGVSDYLPTSFRVLYSILSLVDRSGTQQPT